jgi:hypothetical protein
VRHPWVACAASATLMILLKNSEVAAGLFQ